MLYLLLIAVAGLGAVGWYFAWYNAKAFVEIRHDLYDTLNIATDNGNFRNYNTHQGIDEGDVMWGRYCDSMEKKWLLDELEPKDAQIVAPGYSKETNGEADF